MTLGFFVVLVVVHVMIMLNSVKKKSTTSAIKYLNCA